MARFSREHWHHVLCSVSVTYVVASMFGPLVVHGFALVLQ